jgi:acyl carrier protein
MGARTTADLPGIVAEVLQVPAAEVTEKTGSWTSLRHVQLVSAVEDAYELRFTPRQARKMRSVGAIAAALREHGVPV